MDNVTEGWIVFGLTLVQLVIWVIVAAGVIAIALIALRNIGVSPPPWVMQIFWVVLVVVVAVVAIKFVANF